jgi:hypothetical protein
VASPIGAAPPSFRRSASSSYSVAISLSNQRISGLVMASAFCRTSFARSRYCSAVGRRVSRSSAIPAQRRHGRIVAGQDGRQRPSWRATRAEGRSGLFRPPGQNSATGGARTSSLKNLPQKSRSSIIDDHGPLSNLTTAVRSCSREPLSMPRSGPSGQRACTAGLGWESRRSSQCNVPPEERTGRAFARGGRPAHFCRNCIARSSVLKADNASAGALASD